MEGLLERELSGECRVQHLVRVAEPGRPRWKGDFDLRRVLLVGTVALGAAMEAEHQPVVGTALALGGSDSSQQPTDDFALRAQRWQELLREVLKRLPDTPNPAFAVRGNIREETQDTPAMGWGRRKGIDVEQL